MHLLMEVPPDNELVFVCHCRPCRRPDGYKPESDNEGDTMLDLVMDTDEHEHIRTVSDAAHFVNIWCPDTTLTRNKWSDIPDGTIQIVWGEHCPVAYKLEGDAGEAGERAKATIDDILAGARSKLKPNGMVVFPAYSIPYEKLVPYTPPGWQVNISEDRFPFLPKHINDYRVEHTNGFVIYTKTPSGGRRKGSSGTRRKGSSRTRRGTRRKKLRRKTLRRRT